MSDRTRILAFRGTRTEFVDYLLDLIAGQHEELVNTDPDEYDWELTMAISHRPTVES